MNMLKYDSECVSSSTNGCIMESDKKIRNELQVLLFATS